MFGDFLREIAVLLIALYPLESSIQGTFKWYVFLAVAIFSALLLYFGMILEGENR
jgi:hypothetical protein